MVKILVKKSLQWIHSIPRKSWSRTNWIWGWGWNNTKIKIIRM